MLEIAWNIITDIATEVLKSSKIEEEAEDKEREDVLKNLEKKHSEALKQKRSFFVRMVSDPKLYNPKIVKVKSVNSIQTNIVPERPERRSLPEKII